MADFPQAHAPKDVTDPQNLHLSQAEYPKQLHKPPTFDADGLRVLHYKEAKNEQQEDILRKRGYLPAKDIKDWPKDPGDVDAIEDDFTDPDDADEPPAKKGKKG